MSDFNFDEPEEPQKARPPIRHEHRAKGTLAAGFLGGFGGGVGCVLGIVFGLALLVCGGIYLASRGVNQYVQVAKQQREVEKKAEEDAKTIIAPDKLGELHRFGDVGIAIESIRVGKVRYKFASRDVDETDKEYLIFRVRIVNNSQTRKIDYVPFGSSDYSSDECRKCFVLDDFKNNYRLSSVYSEYAEGRSGYSAIHPGSSIEDVIVFEQPIANAKSFVVRFPGYCVGLDKRFVEFHFPARFIKK